MTEQEREKAIVRHHIERARSLVWDDAIVLGERLAIPLLVRDPTLEVDRSLRHRSPASQADHRSLLVAARSRLARNVVVPPTTRACPSRAWFAG